jgi:hypothetical protein
MECGQISIRLLTMYHSDASLGDGESASLQGCENRSGLPAAALETAPVNPRELPRAQGERSRLTRKNVALCTVDTVLAPHARPWEVTYLGDRSLGEVRSTQRQENAQDAR